MLPAPTVDCFDFNEVADVRAVADGGARTQARERADAAVAADDRLLDHAVRLHDRAGADARVADDIVRTDADAVAEFDLALDDHVDVDDDVASAFKLAAQVEARGIAQGYALLHQLFGLVFWWMRSKCASSSRLLTPRISQTCTGWWVATVTPSATAMPIISVR